MISPGMLELPPTHLWSAAGAVAAKQKHQYITMPVNYPRYRSIVNIATVWNSSKGHEGKDLVYLNSLPRGVYNTFHTGYIPIRVVAKYDDMLQFLVHYGFATSSQRAAYLVQNYAYWYPSVISNTNNLRDALRYEVYAASRYPVTTTH